MIESTGELVLLVIFLISTLALMSYDSRKIDRLDRALSHAIGSLELAAIKLDAIGQESAAEATRHDSVIAREIARRKPGLRVIGVVDPKG